MDIEYRLIRSNRRSIGIEVDREGKVTVRASYSCEEKRIDRSLQEKENWIRQKVALQKENAKKRQEKKEMPEVRNFLRLAGNSEMNFRPARGCGKKQTKFMKRQ